MHVPWCTRNAQQVLGTESLHILQGPQGWTVRLAMHGSRLRHLDAVRKISGISQTASAERYNSALIHARPQGELPCDRVGRTKSSQQAPHLDTDELMQ